MGPSRLDFGLDFHLPAFGRSTWYVFLVSLELRLTLNTGWALPAEIGSTRLRQKTVCLARNASNIAGVIGGTLEAYMM